MNTRNMRPLPWGIGSVAAAVALVLLAVSINLNFGLPFNMSFGFPPGTDYNLRADFQDANGLARGADVVVGGHNIGEVVSISPHGRYAEILMRINSQYAPVHDGSIARLRYSTLLAEKYVELQLAPSWKPQIQDNGLIKVDETVTPVDFDQFLSSFDPETRARLQQIVQQGGGGVAGRETDINDLLSQLHGLSMESRAGLSTFHAHDPDLDRIVLNLAITSNELSNDRAQLGDFIAQTAIVNGTVADQSQSLSVFIDHLTNVMADFDATLNGNEGNMHTAVVTLDPTVVKLNELVGTTFAYYDAYKGELIYSADTLIPFIGSAISQKDSGGNYLRQYLACLQQNSPQNGNPHSHFDANCASMSAPSLSLGLTQPKQPGSSGSAPLIPGIPGTNGGGSTGSGSGTPSPLPGLLAPSPSPLGGL